MIEDLASQLHALDRYKGISAQDIHIEPLQTLAHSEVYRLRIGSRSESLIVKQSGPSDIVGLAARERQFYRHIAPLLSDWLVPEPVLVVEGDQTGRLFIRDLRGSHQPARSPHPARMECRSFVEALATLHGLTGQGTSARQTWQRIAADLPSGGMAERLALFQMALPSFIEAVRDRFDSAVMRFLSGLDRLEGEIKGLGDQHDVIVHGDAHFANALYSPVPRACLIDWGMPMIGFGEIDLAHALALNLPQILRREWEREMQDAYLGQLAVCGAAGEREAFLHRYRLGVAYSIASPVIWWQFGAPESQWGPVLENALGAARDLGVVQ
jgi:aminoglycoside phosphotransferase (APT) family kinase protein